jgi:hypothetical protein
MMIEELNKDTFSFTNLRLYLPIWKKNKFDKSLNENLVESFGFKELFLFQCLNDFRLIFFV